MNQYRMLLVGRIDRQEDRTLLYAQKNATEFDEYRVIAPKDCGVEVGDTVRYEVFGYNFGYYVNTLRHN